MGPQIFCSVPKQDQQYRHWTKSVGECPLLPQSAVRSAVTRNSHWLSGKTKRFVSDAPFSTNYLTREAISRLRRRRCEEMKTGSATSISRVPRQLTLTNRAPGLPYRSSGSAGWASTMDVEEWLEGLGLPSIRSVVVRVGNFLIAVMLLAAGPALGWEHWGRRSRRDAVLVARADHAGQCRATRAGLGISHRRSRDRRAPAVMARTKFQATPLFVEDSLIFCSPFNEVIAPLFQSRHW